MLKVLNLIFSLIILFSLFEIFINLFYPRLIKKNEFKFKKILKKNKFLGWDQKNNFTFHYFHRYLNRAKKIKLKTNNFGVIDTQNYKISKKSINIAFFGDNSMSGFDTKLNDNFISILRNKINSNFEKVKIYNFTKRDFCTLQYYNYYNFFLKKYKFNFVIYVYSHNHSRKNVTIHESFKDIIFTQPIYKPQSYKKINISNNFMNSDNVIIDDKFKVKVNKHIRTSLLTRLYNFSFSFSYLTDLIIGKNNIKTFDNNIEIKDIENQKVNYHWSYTYSILDKWHTILKKNKTKFIITNIPVVYNDPELNHVYAQKISKIKERKKLSKFCKRRNITFYDNYRVQIKKFYRSNPYIHPRYSYLNKKGYREFSDKILNFIKKEIN